MSLKKSIKYNTFIVAYSNYQRAVQDINSRELQLLSSGYLEINNDEKMMMSTKPKSKKVSAEEECYYTSFKRGLYASVIDAISILAYLRLNKQIPKDTYHLVDDLLKNTLDTKYKDSLYIDIIKNSIKKNKNTAINVLWRKIKNK